MEKRRYSQLTLEERCTIARLHQDGGSMRQIASIMGRAASSMAREIKRNSGTQIGYRPAYAEQQTLSRRWRGSRLERNASLRDDVLGRLSCGCSPEQVAGRLAINILRKRMTFGWGDGIRRDGKAGCTEIGIGGAGGGAAAGCCAA